MLRRRWLLLAFLIIPTLFGVRYLLSHQQIGIERLTLCDSRDSAEGPTPCIVPELFFTAGEQVLTATIEIEPEEASTINALSAEVFSVDNNDGDTSGEKISVVEQTIELSNQTAVTFAIQDLLLDVGFYELSVTPASEQARTALITTTIGFVVLPSPEDVLKRLSAQATVSRFKDTIDKIIICADPGGQIHCDSPANTLRTTEVVLADTLFSAVDANDTWLSEGPELTYTLRLIGNETEDNNTQIPEVLFQNTLVIEENTSILGIPLGIGSDGLPPGRYDVVMLLETAESKPVRAMFTITP